MSSRDSLIEANSLSSQSNLPPVSSFAKFIAGRRGVGMWALDVDQNIPHQTSNTLTEMFSF